MRRLNDENFEHHHRIKSNASSWSPRSLNRFNRSSTSKNPACLRIESSPIHPSQWNQKGGELARFLEASSFPFELHNSKVEFPARFGLYERRAGVHAEHR